MRKWRVGTVSMGLSLVLLGGFLFASQVQGFAVFDTLIAWWPLILVVLGAEVLVYVFLSGKDSPVVKYDVFSILFLGVLGTVCIGVVLLTSTGIMNEFRQVVSAEEQTKDLPDIQQEIPEDVERIVVQTGHYPVKIEGTSKRELHLFGTYRTVTAGMDEVAASLESRDFVLVRTVGDTMYVTIKALSRQQGLFDTHVEVDANLVLPRPLQVEVRGEANAIELNPGALQQDWIVRSGAPVTMNLPRDSDILLSAITSDGALSGNAQWTTLTPVEEADTDQTASNPKEGVATADTHGPDTYEGTVKLGKGSHRLDILDSYDVTVNLVGD